MRDNINCLPTDILPLQRSVTVGDLHGNAVLMLYFLIKSGVLKLAVEDDYQQFVAAHKTIYMELVFRAYRDASQFMAAGFSLDEPATQDEIQGLCGSARVQQAMITKLTIDANDTDERKQKVNDRIKNVKDTLEKMQEVIQRATVTDKPCIVRFIGDMIADRGPCDYSIFLLLQKLQEHHANIDVHILLSNHDITSIQHFPFAENTQFNAELGDAQQSSLQSMLSLLQVGLLTPSTVNDIVRKYYLPKLKLIDVSKVPYADPNNPQINRTKFYTHAPIGKALFERLAKCFLGDERIDAFLKNPSIVAFNEIARDINIFFQRWIDERSVQPDGLQTAFTNGVVGSTLMQFVWSREMGDSTHGCPPLEQNWRTDFWGLPIIVFHGHDGSLDTVLGNLNGKLGQGKLDGVIAKFVQECLGQTGLSRRRMMEEELKCYA